MNIERVFKDYDWHPSKGDYVSPNPSLSRKKSIKHLSKDSENVPLKKYLILSVLLIVLIAGIFLF